MNGDGHLVLTRGVPGVGIETITISFVTTTTRSEHQDDIALNAAGEVIVEVLYGKTEEGIAINMLVLRLATIAGALDMTMASVQEVHLPGTTMTTTPAPDVIRWTILLRKLVYLINLAYLKKTQKRLQKGEQRAWLP